MTETEIRGQMDGAKPAPEPLNNSNNKERRQGYRLIDVPPLEALIDAVERAFRDVERGKYKLKDLALVSVLVFTGCKIGEALRLSREDIELENRAIRFKKRGEFTRIVPVPSRLFWDVIEWYIRKYTGDKVFEISERQVRNIVYKFSLRYLKKKIRPHAIRHAYAIAVFRKTKDLEELRRLLGHSDYKHLKHYLEYS